METILHGCIQVFNNEQNYQEYYEKHQHFHHKVSKSRLCHIIFFSRRTSFIPHKGVTIQHIVTCMPAPAFYLSLISAEDLLFIFLYLPCLHAHTTCIIPYKMFGYDGSITNHNLWHRCQWFVTLATYWSHCDVTVMHVRFASPLSFSFVKNSTKTTSVLRPQVNIL